MANGCEACRGQTQRGIESGLFGDRNVFDQQGRLTIDIGELVQRMAVDSDSSKRCWTSASSGATRSPTARSLGLWSVPTTRTSTIGELSP